MNNKKKVLIGSPITSAKRYKAYCLEEYLNGLCQMTYPNKEFMLLLNENDDDNNLAGRYPQLNIQMLPVQSSVVETVVLGRNILRDKALKEGFDYLMFIEQDIVAPYDLVERLMQHQKEVCSALYFNETALQIVRHGVNTLYFPNAWNFDQRYAERGKYVEKLLRPEDLIPGRLMPVDVCGLAAVVIHRKVLEKIQFRFIDNNPPIFEEFCFGRDCREKGIKIYLDASTVCRHYSARGL